MAETASREGNYASEIPSRNLPPVEYRDLPEPKRFGQVVGASVIILATAIGSGEFVLWPYITSQIGFAFMWGAMVGFLIQYFINMEIERYTLATGETALTGFSRYWRPWWWLFIIFALCQNFWPGWATGSATTLSFALGLGENAPIVPITVAALIAIGITLTVSPVVYQVVEKIQSVMVVLIMVFAVAAIFMATSAGDWGDLATQTVTNVGRIPFGQEGLGIALLLGALAFAGAGGANNLVQSNYIRDKGMGMGARIPNIVSPLTGEEIAAPGTGYFFPQTEENLRRWRGWWRVANIEQFVTFYVVGVVSLIIFCVLAYALLPVGQVEQQDFAFIQLEGQRLSEAIAPWFGTAFFLAGTVALFSTNLGIIDYTCRLIADQLKVNALRESEFWTESKIYAAFVWTMITVGSTILISGLEQPLVLLVIASSIAGVMMFIYSGLLIQLNRNLPGELKLRGVRLVVMVISFLFFGFFSVILIYDQIVNNVLGGG
ncbi:MAG: Nramp family divalent metal transporter [Actinomycetota bacterium]